MLSFDGNRKFNLIREEPLLPEKMFFSLETYLLTPFESQVLAVFLHQSLPKHKSVTSTQQQQK